jgi:hypothetical protein
MLQKTCCVLRGMMTGSELDHAIATVLAQDALAIERRRRRDWQKREENAAKFKEQFAALQLQVACDQSETK